LNVYPLIIIYSYNNTVIGYYYCLKGGMGEGDSSKGYWLMT